MWNAPRTDSPPFAPAPRAKAADGRRRVTILLMMVVALADSMACAAEMRPPRVSHINPDWDAVRADLTSTAPAQDPTIADLNRATAQLLPNIAASPVPVLLPFDLATFLSDRAAGSTDKPVDDYLKGFHLSRFFLPGPSGYDAMFTAKASEMPELGISFSGSIEVFISGFSLIYDLDEPARLSERPVKGFDSDFLGIEHVLLENYARNTFTRYGVPYAVSILCFDGSYSRYHMITCRDAGKVAERFLKALRVAGGTPARQPTAGAPSTIERPAAQSPDFTFRSPGDIIPGTGIKHNGGRADYTVYSKMRFPLLDAPAYANSQSFMNWGDCDSTGRVSVGMSGTIPTYRCRIGGPVLLRDESAGTNYAYPWRDNFCEHRYFTVGECPGGLGHQGQDIRPSSCTQRFVGGSCEPYQHDVVAVREGMVLRAAGQMPVYLFVNAPQEHIRFRYLHMSPRQLDADAVLTGRLLQQGETFGKVGSYFQHERATTYHLHFDMQVPTKYGWVFVNPYMTLVAAYERLIGGRGTDIEPESPSATMAPPLPTGPPPQGDVGSEGEDRIEGPSYGSNASNGNHDEQVAREPANGPAGPRGGDGTDTASIGGGAEPAATVRPMGRGFPRPSDRPGHFRRHLYAGHARPKAGHNRI